MEPFDAIARYYDLDCGHFDDDLALYCNLAARTGRPVVELGSGTGRVLDALARAGHQVTGVEPSDAMLAIARGRISQWGDRVRLIQGHAETFSTAERFRFAIFALGGFNLLIHDTQQRRALTNVRDHLARGGVLAIDVAVLDPAELADVDGALLLEWTRPNPDAGETVAKLVCRSALPQPSVEHVTIFYDRVGPAGELRRAIGEYDQRRITADEIGLLLDRTGFELEHLYGSYDLDDYTSMSDRMIVVARRRE